MKTPWLILLLLITTYSLPAQENRYETYMDEGKRLLASGVYKEAVQNFILARYTLEADPQNSLPDQYLERALRLWTSELDSARLAQKKLTDLEIKRGVELRIYADSLDLARLEAESNRMKAESERDRAERIAKINHALLLSVKADEYLNSDPPRVDDALHLAYLALDPLTGLPLIPNSIRDRFREAVWAKYGAVRKLHRGGYIHMELDAATNRIITIGRDSVVKILDLEGQLIYASPHHNDHVFSAALDESGQYLLTACKDGNAYLWALGRDVSPITLRGDGSAVMEARFLPGGETMIGITDGRQVHIWDRSGQTQDRLDFRDSGRLRDLIIRGQHVLVRSAREVSVWPVDEPSALQKLPMEGALILSAQLSDDGRRVLITTNRGARLWNWRDNEVQAFGEDQRIFVAAFHPTDASFVTGSTTGHLLNWRFTGGPAQTIAEYEDAIDEINYAEDGVLQVRAGQEVFYFSPQYAEIPYGRQQVAITDTYLSPDGQYVLAGTADGEVTFRTSAGENILDFEMESGISYLSMTADNEYLISGTADGSLGTCLNPEVLLQKIRSGAVALPSLLPATREWLDQAQDPYDPRGE